MMHDRSIVAKYCLKDCSLCNRLIAKLQILPNSIGMANVCCVPLSIFVLRGQSIKIFYSGCETMSVKKTILSQQHKKKFKKPVVKDAKGNIVETD